jgi:hypothetical protein
MQEQPQQLKQYRLEAPAKMRVSEAATLDVPVFTVIVSVQVPRGRVVEPELVKVAEAALEAVHAPSRGSMTRGIERQAVSPLLDLVIVRLSPVLGGG